MSPVRYELEFYIPEDGILHSLSRENLKTYNVGLHYVVQRDQLQTPKEALEGHGIL
jgi:hypothetical protein